MSKRVSLLKRVSISLMRHAVRVLPPKHSAWAEAMRHAMEHIESDWTRLRWAAGCVVASYSERRNERPNSLLSILRKPSAFLPVVMSLTALATVLVSIAIFGVVHETDEGVTAHIWQLLMAGQMPILALFALKWFPRAPKQTLYVLAVQAGSVLAAMAPVFYWKL